MRSEKFRNKTTNRYWWHHLEDTNYIPDIYRLLSDDEWSILDSWFSETDEKFVGTGEMQVPAISFICSLINANGISRIVQCGHYIGYSTLLLGFTLRRMGKDNCVFTIDIDETITNYTKSWIAKAKLEKQVEFCVKNSSDPILPSNAEKYFSGKKPQLVIIDSSHSYGHTLKELDVWWDALADGGFIVMHDVSVFASSFDSTKNGGVHNAILDWLDKHNENNFLRINSFVDHHQNGNDLSYKDGCGLGIIQKKI